MFIFFAVITSVIFGLNFIARKAVEDYEFGGGSFREWREFEAMHKRVF